MKNLRIALAQINPVVGALKGNTDKIIDFIQQAKALKANIVVFPELSLCGYPPEDLLLKPHFIKQTREYLNKIIKASDPIFSIVGLPFFYQGKLFNAAALIYKRKLLDVYRKVYLPNYGVFDEMRYFKSGDSCQVVAVGRNLRLGVNICEDIWYPHGPQRIQARKGKANIIINISASPYHVQKVKQRQQLLKRRAKENNAYVLYCNLVGGQDELVFDGASMAIDPGANLIARARQFQEDLLLVDIDTSRRGKGIKNRIEPPLKSVKEIYSALLLGLKDYVIKNGFKKVVLGLSGGIDSAMVATLAAEALGKDNVIALSMPSMYSSKQTQQDLKILAKNLGIRLLTIPITGLYKSYLATLKTSFKGRRPDVTEENLQARIRGTLLMAFSNKFGWLVVATGNKSELSVGYCTLYGDTVGGFAVLKDVPKTLVYKLARHVNEKASKSLIPKTIIQRPPSAELKKSQRDEDTLPPYSKLDKILDAYVQKDKKASQIITKGYSKRLVKEIISMVDRNEYKRRQSPVGVKITPKAFGRDRRMPITNKFYR